jgi:uncharacterized protein YcfL
MKKFCCVALILCPLFAAGCSSEQDKSVVKTTEEAVAQPTKQSETGGAAGSEAKVEDRTKPES